MSISFEQRVIADALRVIQNRSHWTRGVSRRGRRYCAFAALMNAANGLTNDQELARRIVAKAEQMIVEVNGWKPGTRLAHFNDRHTHKQVIRALHAAKVVR